MEASFKQSATLTMRQEQALTHQQIQALELLSTPMLELSSMVAEEMQSNPVLDGADREEPAEAEVDDQDAWLDKILKLDSDSRYIPNASGRVSAEEEERRQHYLDSVEYEMTLHESLIQQLHLQGLTDELCECCEVVVSSLNDNGYLTSHPADLAMVAGVPMDLIEDAISVVQQLEPVGVGARDLQERLLIQLERQGRMDSLTYQAVRDHLQDLANNLLPAVARKMKISIADVQEIHEEIKGLNPRIDRGRVNPSEFIEEEVMVLEKSGRLEVVMNNDYLPSLRISRHYKELLRRADTPKEVRDYIKEKIRSGVFLINSILQRQTTIEKIVRAIVEHQADYFHNGTNMLKPLTMAEIADKSGVHETTVSRAVAGKYLRCKQGLVPMRNFFTTGYTTESGDVVSNVVVKNAIRELIGDEDAFHPLSDSQISTCLKDQGLKVARRTVAKYRESLGILSSNLRRAYS